MIDSEIKPSETIENTSSKHFVSETETSARTANSDPDSDDGSGVVMLGAEERTSTGSTSPASDAENVEANNSPGARKRRNRKQIRDDEVTALELALMQAKAKRDAFKREQAELAADTNALQSGRELAGALLQKAIASGDSAAVDVWDALTRRAAAADARRMEKMRAILGKRGHARREGSGDQAAPGQLQVDPGEASATA